MSISILRNTSITLAAALLIAGTVQAANTASASVKNFKLTLIDTNLNDGIDATITFNDPSGFWYGTYVGSQAYTYDPETNLGDFSEDFNDGIYQGGFINANNASASASSASAQSQATGNSISVSATADFMHPSSMYPTGQHAYAASTASPNISSFTLSANTVLLIQGDFSLSASVGDRVSDYAYPDYASAEYFLDSRLNTSGGYQSFSSWYSLYAVDVSLIPFFKSQSAEGSFYGSLFNGSSISQEGNITLYVNAAAERHYNITPVPEAETMALALAGLSVVGCLVRRRRG